MPITKQLLQLGRSAHAHYVLRLDKEEAQTQLTLQKEPAAQMEAQKQQLAKEKKDLKSKEKQLERQEAAQQECMEDGNAILKEPNAKLRAAMRHKDFKEVSVAQAMIEASEKISSANKAMQQTREQQQSFKTKADHHKHLSVTAQQAKIQENVNDKT